MKRVIVPVLMMGAAMGLACSQPVAGTAGTGSEAVEPPAAALPVEVPPAIAKVIEEREKLHKRQTGARLLIAAKWEKQPGVEDGIAIDWQIDYDGPRRPFIILTPGIGGGQSIYHCWYLDVAGHAAYFRTGAGGSMGAPPIKRKEWFSIAADGKLVVGRFEKGASYMKKGFGGKEPGPGDPHIWVQMEYVTTDRGDGNEWLVDPTPAKAVSKGPEWTLDAWTGQLWSAVVPVCVD